MKSVVNSVRPLSAPPAMGRGDAKLRRTALATAIVAVMGVCPVMAQQAPSRLPSGAEQRSESPRPIMPLPSTPGGPITTPNAPTTEAPVGAESHRLVLKAVVVEGATAYTVDQIRAMYQDLIGREVTVADLFKVANDIELRYRNDGYITSRVIVPAQTITDGAVRLQVVEGFVSEITYPDDIGPALAAVKRLVNPLRGTTPINIAEIERRLLLANDLAGLTVRANLEPSRTERGASVIVVKTERKAVDASASFSNRNSPYLGSSQVGALIAFNSFGPNADTLSLFGRLSVPLKRARSIGGGYQALLSDDGLTIGANVSYSHSRPGLTLDPLDVRGGVVAGTATLSYPVIRSRSQNLRLVGELEYRDVSTDLAGDRFNRDKLRIFRTGVSYDLTDDWDGITAVRGMVHKGLDILGASERGAPLASRERGRGDFTKLTADITRVQQLPANLSLVATATAQLAQTSLLASEQIALGGPNYGRAFDEGEVSNDNGWAGSLELRYTPSLPENDIAQGLQFFGFVDGGRVWSRSSADAVPKSTVLSVGGGVRGRLLERVFATLEVDKPLNRRVATRDDKDMRVFFSVTIQY